MGKMMLSLLSVLILLISGCGEQEKKRILFDGGNLAGWLTEGTVNLSDSVIGMADAGKMTLKNATFTDFELLVTARTVEKGKGEVRFHTDENGNGGYAVALDNDTDHPEWWTKTGSLLSVRNLVKSIVDDNEW